MSIEKIVFFKRVVLVFSLLNSLSLFIFDDRLVSASTEIGINSAQVETPKNQTFQLAYVTHKGSIYYFELKGSETIPQYPKAIVTALRFEGDQVTHQENYVMATDGSLAINFLALYPNKTKISQSSRIEVFLSVIDGRPYARQATTEHIFQLQHSQKMTFKKVAVDATNLVQSDGQSDVKTAKTDQQRVADGSSQVKKDILFKIIGLSLLGFILVLGSVWRYRLIKKAKAKAALEQYLHAFTSKRAKDSK